MSYNKKISYMNMDIYKTSNNRYSVHYGEETFTFVNLQDVISWVGLIRRHECRQGFVRSDAGLEPEGEE